MSGATDTVDLGRRVRRAGAALEYLVLSIPLGLICAVTAALLLLGAALGAIWIGLPILLFAVAACARLAEFERRQANRLLNAHIAPLHPPVHHEGTLFRRAIAALTDRDNWRVLLLVATKLPVAVVGLAAGLFPIAVTAWLLIFGHLPTRAERSRFDARLAVDAHIHEAFKHHFEGFPSNAPPRLTARA